MKTEYKYTQYTIAPFGNGKCNEQQQVDGLHMECKTKKEEKGKTHTSDSRLLSLIAGIKERKLDFINLI